MTDDTKDSQEEILLYIDFDTSLLPSEFDSDNLDIKIIGIDTENPIAEVNGKLFKGTFDFSVGTNVFFESQQDHAGLDPLFDIVPGEMYKYFSHTNKKLKMQRLFVENKTDCKDSVLEESMDELKSRLEVKMSYGEALNLLLPPGAHPPRRVSTDNMEECENSSDNDPQDPDYSPETAL